MRHSTLRTAALLLLLSTTSPAFGMDDLKTPVASPNPQQEELASTSSPAVAQEAREVSLSPMQRAIAQIKKKVQEEQEGPLAEASLSLARRTAIAFLKREELRDGDFMYSLLPPEYDSLFAFFDRTKEKDKVTCNFLLKNGLLLLWCERKLSEGKFDLVTLPIQVREAPLSDIPAAASLHQKEKSPDLLKLTIAPFLSEEAARATLPQKRREAIAALETTGAAAACALALAGGVEFNYGKAYFSLLEHYKIFVSDFYKDAKPLPPTLIFSVDTLELSLSKEAADGKIFTLPQPLPVRITIDLLPDFPADTSYTLEEQKKLIAFAIFLQDPDRNRMIAKSLLQGSNAVYGDTLFSFAPSVRQKLNIFRDLTLPSPGKAMPPLLKAIVFFRFGQGNVPQLVGQHYKNNDPYGNLVEFPLIMQPLPSAGGMPPGLSLATQPLPLDQFPGGKKPPVKQHVQKMPKSPQEHALEALWKASSGMQIPSPLDKVIKEAYPTAEGLFEALKGGKIEFTPRKKQEKKALFVIDASVKQPGVPKKFRHIVTTLTSWNKLDVTVISAGHQGPKAHWEKPSKDIFHFHLLQEPAESLSPASAAASAGPPLERKDGPSKVEETAANSTPVLETEPNSSQT